MHGDHASENAAPIAKERGVPSAVMRMSRSRGDDSRDLPEGGPGIPGMSTQETSHPYSSIPSRRRRAMS